MNSRNILVAVFAASILVTGIDLFTNSIDIKKYSWDFHYYIEMAEKGFDVEALASPFAYRYPTPFLAGELTRLLGLSTGTAFRIIAYLGAVLQLSGIVMFVYGRTKSLKGAYAAMLTTAFSLFNVKFLLFDVFRPDHLAYAIILLSTWLFLEKRWGALMLVTLVGSQIREYALIPLMAGLLVLLVNKEWRNLKRIFIPALLIISFSVILPRWLIPVDEDYAFLQFSRSGILTVLRAFGDMRRNFNFLYTSAIYFLPLAMLLTVKRFGAAVEKLSSDEKFYYLFYALLVFSFNFIGGTDFDRFAAYLFLPQVVLIGFIAAGASIPEIVVCLAAVFLFNRIPWQFPIWDLEKYLDFYGGYDGRVNSATFLRITECFFYLVLSYLIKQLPARSS